MREREKKTPTFLLGISCIIVLVLIVGVGNGIMGISIQPLLLLCTAYAAFVGKYLGYSWKEMEEGVSRKLEKCMPAIFIIISVGIVVGTWIFSGTVPMLIYYGLKIINPQYFLVTAFLIVAIVSTATGTAWGSTATAGVALMGIAAEMNIPLGIAAGAVIAGGVFGDKLSPLSDTTNLSSMVCGADLFQHIKHMLYTTVPSAIVGMVVWFIVGKGFSATGSSDSIAALTASLEGIYNFNLFLLLPIVVILVGSLMKYPTVPLMLLSSVIAVILGTVSHGFSIVNGFTSMMSGFKVTMLSSAVAENANIVTDQIKSLVERGGMTSMMTIVITIFCGYAFAGIVETTGCLNVMLEPFYKKVTKVWQLIAVTIVASAILVFTAGVASISIMMVGSVMLDVYKKMNLAPVNLSRTLEDSGTMLIPFVPWGASGIFYKEVLGVAVGGYWMWAIPCYMCVVFAMIYGFTGLGIKKLDSSKVKDVAIVHQNA